MKKLITMILLASTVGPSAFAKLEAVSNDEMAIYAKVLQSQNLNCGGALDQLTYVYNNPVFKVDKTGGQPAFLISIQKNGERNVLALYTSADQKRVTHGNGEYFSREMVNRGTVVNPKYVEEWISSGKYTCSSQTRN